MSDVSELAGRRVLVTGGDGFIGSHLVERLVHEGAQVTATCLYNSAGSHGWLDPSGCSVADRIEAVLVDIRDSDQVRRLVPGHEIVFHLAALVSIPHSYQAPRSHAETNVVGTLNVLEACREANVARLIHTSTSEVYGTPETVPITETHPLVGQSPYSASKIGADMMVEAYVRSYGLEAMTLRPFNTYGPRQSARAIIPTVLGQLLAGTDRLELGNLEPRRDFTFVDDTVDGFIRLATAAVDPGLVVQLGTGEAVSIAELVDRCMAVVGRRVPVTTDEQRVRPAPSEVDVLVSDPARADATLGWRPSVSLDDGLARVANWMADGSLPIDPLGYQR